jgi:hypothetical protein
MAETKICDNEYVFEMADSIITEALKHRKVKERNTEYYYQDDDREDIYVRHRKQREYDYTDATKRFVELLREALRSMDKECGKKLIDAVDYLLSESYLYEFQRALKEVKREYMG